MTWVLLGVICAAVIYILSVAREYRDFMEKVQPRIEELGVQAEENDKRVEEQASLLNGDRERFEEEERLTSIRHSVTAPIQF